MGHGGSIRPKSTFPKTSQQAKWEGVSSLCAVEGGHVATKGTLAGTVYKSAENATI
jgi:hypothetical protein